MDGNGRWAQARRLPRQAGHRAGIDTVRRIVRAANERGIQFLTLYSFSSENWRRPASEVGYLMDLLRFFFRREIADLHANDVQVRFLGEREGLAGDICELMDNAQTKTKDNTGLVLSIAFNYGAQRELTQAAEHILKACATGQLNPASINETLVSKHLFDPTLPDPELVIRTAGDQRLSNFLLWQAEAAQLCFVETHWPDFHAADFDNALTWYAEGAPLTRGQGGQGQADLATQAASQTT